MAIGLTYIQATGQEVQGAGATFPALVNADSSGNLTTPNELWIKNSSGL